MGKSIYSLIPDPEAILSLEPEELAGVLLEHLNSISDQSFNRYNFSLYQFREYEEKYRDEIRQALMEAWVWLEKEGLLAPKPGSMGDFLVISRRGKKLQTAADVNAYRDANILPKKLLHPKISQKVWATFLRGDYDTAVFQAFKEVEVSVREATGLPDEEVGVNLVRKAFKPDDGPLTNTDSPRAEQESLANLFAGAIGSYKNPHSHRNVKIMPTEAVEMIILASHLLQIVDNRVIVES